MRVNVQGSKLPRRKQQAGGWGCAEHSRGPELSRDLPRLPRYLLLVLLLHQPEMLVPLLVHFEQLYGETGVSGRQAEEDQREPTPHTPAS